MNSFLKLNLGVLFLSLVMLSACSSVPKTTEIWMDEAYVGSRVNKVLVIGVAEKITFQTIFEGKFADQLEKKGIEAVPSYTVMQPNAELSKATVLPLVKKLGIDAVIVTSLIDRKDKTVFYQVNSGNLYNYYNGQQRIYVKSGKTASYKVPILVLKTNLYDVNTEKLVWSITSESEFSYKIDSLNSAIEFLIRSLAKDDLI